MSVHSDEQVAVEKTMLVTFTLLPKGAFKDACLIRR